MNAHEELQRLGWHFEPNAPLRDARRPLAMAFKAAADGSFIAAAALGVERFLVRLPASDHVQPDGSQFQIRAAWVGVVDAMARLEVQREIWHVVSTRRPPGPDGSLLATGWVGIGRAASAHVAAADAEAALNDLRSIVDAHLEFVNTQPVTAAEALMELLRPAGAPFLRSFRRRRWEPPFVIESEDSKHRIGGQLPGVLLPWSGETPPWAPLLDALAVFPSHAGIVCRILTARRPGYEAVRCAERDLWSVADARQRVLGGRAGEVAPLDGVLTALFEAASDRLKTLKAPCLGVDVTVAAWEQIPPGLSAIAASCLTRSAIRQRDHTFVAAPALGAVPPVATSVDLLSGSLIEPLEVDTNSELLVGPREAVSLVRTAEPPVDERSPLACSRARVLPMRSHGDVGARMGEARLYGRACDVQIADATRFQHVYVVGQTGTGKSTLMLSMAVDDILAGHGVTVLDPHGALVAQILDHVPASRAEDVIVVNPSDTERFVPLNPLCLRSTESAEYLARRDQVIDELLDTFDALYDLRQTGGPMFEQYFRTFTSLLLGSRQPESCVPILPMLTLVMSNRKLARRLADRLGSDDPITRATLDAIFEARGEADLQNMIPYVVSKLTRFYMPVAARRMLCQDNTLDFSALLERRRILLVELPKTRLGTEAAALIARQIVGGLSAAAIARGADPGSAAHFVYVDEFHQFATERFATLLAEARKFRLGLVLAHQHTSQLIRRGDRVVLDAVLGNVGTVAAFRVGVQDAELLKDFFAPLATARDISGLPNYTALLRSSAEFAGVPFTLRTRLPEATGHSRAAEIREQSRLIEARPREEIDASIERALKSLRQIVEGEH